MEYDAFTGGVAPGGLRSKSDIRILICYMLKSVNAPLSGDDIIKVLQEKSLANYFEASDALSALVSLGNVTREEDNTYVLTKRGKSVADDLEQLIPSSVRDKAATALLASAKMERENVATIVRTENGYNVTCHISGGEMELMSLSVYVPDLYQAREVKKNFHRDPQRVYNLMLAALTGDDEMMESFRHLLNSEEPQFLRLFFFFTSCFSERSALVVKNRHFSVCVLCILVCENSLSLHRIYTSSV